MNESFKVTKQLVRKYSEEFMVEINNKRKELKNEYTQKRSSAQILGKR